MIDKDILEIIACPRCKNGLILKEDNLICKPCNKKYEIKEDIPILID